jgi:hypothetical protein
MLSAPLVPRIPRPVPRRLSPKPMTIAAGFVCSDGLLFASDTLYSGLENRDGQKFWLIEGWGEEARLIFGGAGTEAGLKRTRDEIERRARPTADRFDVIGAVEESLALVEEKMRPSDFERTSALVGIRVADRYWLYENQGGKSLLSPIDYNSQCVGAGSSLGLYFVRSLFRDNMAIRWAKIIAAHLIKQVKIYNDGYCGGATQLLALPQVGEPEWITKKEDIRDLEAYLSRIDSALQIVFPDKSTNEEAVQARIELINDVVEHLKFDLTDDSSVTGHMVFGGGKATLRIRQQVSSTEEESQ